MADIAGDIKVVAIIPARGDSKRIPRKNLQTIAGKPLVVHSIEHAQQARLVRTVYVSTDDAEIAAVSEAAEAEVILRPARLASDSATSESALLHALDTIRSREGIDPDAIVFLQCTSPVRRRGDIDAAVRTLLDEAADSLFSACDNNWLLWRQTREEWQSLNYDYRRRQREQELPQEYRENGSIYVFRPWVLRKLNNRLGGKIAIYKMDYWSSFQVDTSEHIELCEWILRRPQYRPLIPWPPRIELVVFDFDGVMTDNTVIVDEKGGESVICHRGDGWGTSQLRELDVPMLVLSTETNLVIAARCAKLGLPCHQGVRDKAAYLKSYLCKHNISATNVVYVGNDLNDLGCLRLVGFPVAVADSQPEILMTAQWVLTKPGGRGAVHEFCGELYAHLVATEGKPR